MPELPGIEESNPPQLTSEARRAVDAHLLRYAKLAFALLGAVGLATIGGVTLSMLYIFFRLPEQAADRAFRAWDTKFARYETRMEDALITALELRALAKSYEEQNKSLQSDLERIGESIASLEDKRSSLQISLDNLSPEDLKRAETIASSLDAKTLTSAKESAAQALERSSRAISDLDLLQQQLDEAVGLLQDVTIRIGILEERVGGTQQDVDATLTPVNQ